MNNNDYLSEPVYIQRQMDKLEEQFKSGAINNEEYYEEMQILIARLSKSKKRK